MRAGARTYTAGDRLGQLELLRPLGRNTRGNVEWVVRCDCGREVVRSTNKFSDNKPMCPNCSRADSVRKSYPRKPKSSKAPCYACFDLPHRIEGAICIGCDQPFQEQPETRAEVRWQSSAGYTLAFSHG